MPRLYVYALLLTALVALGACGGEPPESLLAGEGPESLVALAVEVDALAETDSAGAVRATVQADAAGASWYDALAAPGRDRAMGMAVDGRTVLHSWRWWSDADSVGLGPADRVRGIARPDVAVRSYLERDTTGFIGRLIGQLQGERPARMSERVTLLDRADDGQAALLIEVADSIGTVGFWPVRSERRAAGDYRVQDLGGVLVFAAAADVPTDSTVIPEGPIWTAVAAEGDGGVRSTRAASAVPEGGRDQAFRLGEVVLETPGAVAVATGPTPEIAARAARFALVSGAARRQARSARLAAVVEGVGFESQDETMNAAVRWATVMLDALTVRDSTQASILPGLAGAEPASYPSAAATVGAFLATGRWETARGLIATMGAAQVFDRRLDLLGRAPDLVRLGDADDEFRTAEGTPLFLGAAGDYVRTTGDRSLVTGSNDFWFKTVFALRGVFEPDSRNGAATDSLGFLVARGRRGTFLESDPERGGIERRGAIAEGQGALFQALRTATQFARIMGVAQRSSAVWYADTSAVLVRNLEARFVRDGLMADRLEPSGPATDLRPAGLLALARIDRMDPATRAQQARALAERLVFSYGVASLAQSDSMFHPYLTAPAFYTPEAARTGGAVHTWLAGPVITLMAETGGAAPAAELLQAQALLLLDTGVVGAIPELVSGHPRASGMIPEVGGAPIQPWSLASFLEATYRGLVGARYQTADTLVVAPRMPETWGETTVRLRMRDGHVGLRLDASADGLEATVEPGGGLAAAATLVLEAAGRRVAVPLATASDTTVTPRDAFTVAITADGATVDGEAVASEPLAAPPDAWADFAFAAPDLRQEYSVMRAVANQRALTDAEILRDNPRAAVVMTQTDPQGDDWGATSTFEYPEGVPASALDGTYMEVARDDSTTYFRAEFASLGDGGQTIVAFAIDSEEGGAETVGRGADYDFPEGGGYEYVVFVGEGLVVEDAAGRELGRLESGSAFDTATGTLQFALPSFVVPTVARRTRVTMLVGALAPGGGVGRFRRVADEASEDTGGGRVDRRSPNVYDVLVGRTR